MHHKCKNFDCALPDTVLCFELLQASQLEERQVQLVLTSVDYATGKANKNLLNQMKTALRKFKGRAIFSGTKDLPIKSEEETFVTKEVEAALLAIGWKKPPKKRGGSPVITDTKLYQGMKNPLCKDGKPLKCFKCECEHDRACTCPCVYHLANTCTTKGLKDEESNPSEMREARRHLGLFMTANTTFDEYEKISFDIHDAVICLISDNLKNLKNPSEIGFRVLLDCACPTTVTGFQWLKKFLSMLTLEQKRVISIYPSQRVYKFGGGEKSHSKYVVKFPCCVAGNDVFLITEVIDENLPLLLGNSSLKASHAVLNIGEKNARILGNDVAMREELSGHFGLPIEPHQDSNGVNKWRDVDICLVIRNNELTEKNIWHCHHYFEHASSKKLEKLIRNAGKRTPEVRSFLNKLESCESCMLNKNRRPKPKISLPRAERFNQIVTLDLKQYKFGKISYISYAVDMFSRLTAATFIEHKNVKSVAEALLKCWISQAGLGTMEMLHSDRGSEFLNEELTKLADYLMVKQTSKAAFSPNANGCNERNHAIVDAMMSKMLDADPDLNPEVVLAWCINAKNTLENYQGFSPAQIVFGRHPRLPNLMYSGPPGFEEVIMTKAVAQHINAMHLARESFIQCESSRLLRAALKARVFKTSNEINPGDWVYFKNHRKWEGPLKVTTKDGKLIYAVRANKLLTINVDNVFLGKPEGELLPLASDSNKAKSICSSSSIKPISPENETTKEISDELKKTEGFNKVSTEGFRNTYDGAAQTHLSSQVGGIRGFSADSALAQSSENKLMKTTRDGCDGTGNPCGSAAHLRRSSQTGGLHGLFRRSYLSLSHR